MFRSQLRLSTRAFFGVLFRHFSAQSKLSFVRCGLALQCECPALFPDCKQPQQQRDQQRQNSPRKRYRKSPIAVGPAQQSDGQADWPSCNGEAGDESLQVCSQCCGSRVTLGGAT